MDGNDGGHKGKASWFVDNKAHNGKVVASGMITKSLGRAVGGSTRKL